MTDNDKDPEDSMSEPIRPALEKDATEGKCGECDAVEDDDRNGSTGGKIGEPSCEDDQQEGNVEADIDEGWQAESEEARPGRAAAEPGRPTRREIDEHNRTHMPFRSWCTACVQGRSVSSPHMKKTGKKQGEEERERRLPTVAMDYCHLGQRDEKEKAAVLVLRAAPSGALRACWYHARAPSMRG